MVMVFCLFAVFYFFEFYKDWQNLNKNILIDFLFYILIQGTIVTFITFNFIDGFFEKVNFRILDISFLPVIVQFFVLAIVIEFIIYWIHRLFHKVPWLWEFHKIHHSANNLHAFVAYRTHIFEALFLITLKAFLFVMFSVNASVIFAYIFFSRIHALFIHSSIDADLGWLKNIFVTPNRHKIHHSSDPKHFNANFSDRFVFFDILFKTPKDFSSLHDSDLLKFGVGKDFPKTYFHQFIQPFKRIFVPNK
jgi:sterol desaturase/sphingolipid hydroxylase (fatty acid hydroxylase superfamily)